MADDAAVEFGDPRGDLVRADEPGDGVVDSFDGVAVAAVDLDERGPGCG